MGVVLPALTAGSDPPVCSAVKLQGVGLLERSVYGRVESSREAIAHSLASVGPAGRAGQAKRRHRLGSSSLGAHMTNQDTPPTDEELERAIRDQFYSDPKISMDASIGVSVQKGEVTLPRDRG